MQERRNLRGRHRSELGCQLGQAIPEKTIMAVSTNEVTLDDAGRHQISVSGVSGLAPSQVWGAGSGHCCKSSKHLRNFRVGTLNVNTLKGRVCEVVETLSRRKVDLCCVQETRYRGGHRRIITGKDSRYKLFWSGNSKGTAGVGVFVAEKWIEKVFEVKQVSDRIILVKIIVGQRMLCLLSVYAPQCGLSDSVKDLFYDQLRAVTAMIPASEFLIPCGDWNGHVGVLHGLTEAPVTKKFMEAMGMASQTLIVRVRGSWNMH